IAELAPVPGWLRITSRPSLTMAAISPARSGPSSTGTGLMAGAVSAGEEGTGSVGIGDAVGLDCAAALGDGVGPAGAAAVWVGGDPADGGKMFKPRLPMRTAVPPRTRRERLAASQERRAGFRRPLRRAAPMTTSRTRS